MKWTCRDCKDGPCELYNEGRPDFEPSICPYGDDETGANWEIE